MILRVITHVVDLRKHACVKEIFLVNKKTFLVQFRTYYEYIGLTHPSKIEREPGQEERDNHSYLDQEEKEERRQDSQ